MKLYFAGPLFTQAERDWNARMAAALVDAGHSVFLPQTEVKAITTLDADTIFAVDVDGVRGADAVVAVMDGADPDSGTSFECGLAYALGLPIVLLRTDFRAGGDALPRQKLATINLMPLASRCRDRRLPRPRHPIRRTRRPADPGPRESSPGETQGRSALNRSPSAVSRWWWDWVRFGFRRVAGSATQATPMGLASFFPSADSPQTDGPTASITEVASPLP